MRCERQLLRIGEYLLGRACQCLPSEARDERYREWAAELPAILRDPEIRLTSRRAFRMLRFAAGTIRGTARMPGQPSRRPTPSLAFLGISVPAALSLAIWGIVQSPGDWVNYAAVTWNLLFGAVATWSYRRLLRRRGRRIHAQRSG